MGIFSSNRMQSLFCNLMIDFYLMFLKSHFHLWIIVYSPIRPNGRMYPLLILMADHKKLERVLKASANRRRFNILAYLRKEKEASVGKIATHIHLSFKATSRHLSILSNVGILEKEQEGLVVWHRLSTQKLKVVPEVLKLL